MNQYGNNQNQNYVPGQPISIPNQNMMNQNGNTFQAQSNNMQQNNNGYNNSYPGNQMNQPQYPAQPQQPQMNPLTQDQKKPSVWYRDWETDRKSTRLNSSHSAKSRMPSSA